MVNIFDNWRALSRRSVRALRASAPPLLTEEQEGLRQTFAELYINPESSSQAKEDAKHRGRREFLALIRNPRIQGVGFDDEGTLHVGTTCVYHVLSSDPLTYHRIGEFIIELNVEEKRFSFTNLTPLTRMAGSIHHHPNIHTNGMVCMAEMTRTSLLMSINGRNVLQAVEKLVAMAFTYGTPPVIPLTEWPEMTPQEVARYVTHTN